MVKLTGKKLLVSVYYRIVLTGPILLIQSSYMILVISKGWNQQEEYCSLNRIFRLTLIII